MTEVGERVGKNSPSVLGEHHKHYIPGPFRWDAFRAHIENHFQRNHHDRLYEETTGHHITFFHPPSAHDRWNVFPGPLRWDAFQAYLEKHLHRYHHDRLYEDTTGHHPTPFHPPFAHDRQAHLEKHFHRNDHDRLYEETTVLSSTLLSHMTNGTCSRPISVGRVPGLFRKTVPTKRP